MELSDQLYLSNLVLQLNDTLEEIQSVLDDEDHVMLKRVITNMQQSSAAFTRMAKLADVP